MVHRIIIPKPAASGLGYDPDFESERERLHRQMLSSVSHDLKTPLASMIGALEVFVRMKDKLSAEKQSALIEVALQESYRLDSFITNILDMAKLENNMVTAKHEPGEFGVIVRDCLLRMDNRLRGSTVRFEPPITLNVTTDHVLFSRAICLVLDNAVKYGGAPSLIHIEVGRDKNNGCYISVRDNGRGLDETQLDVIFSKYTRFVKEDQENAGTGLGLAISRSIMNLLGGTITAANHASGGAQFTLRLPQR